MTEMDVPTKKLAELADRIERDLKRIDEVATVTARRHLARSPPSTPGPRARLVAMLRRVSKIQRAPAKVEDDRFAEVQRRLESLEQYRAELLREAARHRATADEWERNAKLAIRAGADDLAREALGRKGEALGLAVTREHLAETISAALAEYTSAVAAIKASSR